MCRRRRKSAAWRSDVPAVRQAATPSGSRPDLTQEEHVDGLPIGTRGGAVVHYTFPLDGEYEIHDSAGARPRRARRGSERAPRSRAAAGSRAGAAVHGAAAAAGRRILDKLSAVPRQPRSAPQSSRSGESRSARRRRGVSEAAVGAARNRASALPGALQFLPASPDSAGHLLDLDHRSLCRDRPGRDAQPPPDFRVAGQRRLPRKKPLPGASCRR